MPERYRVQLDRDVLTAKGPEAATFLQGQLSQDVLGLADGGHAWSWLLAPAGKVEALVRVWRRDPASWVIETDAGWGEAVLTRLDRFKLRTKVDLAPSPASVEAWRGVGLPPPPAVGVLVADPPWPGVAGVDVLRLESVGPEDDLPSISAEEYEAERILSGIPRMGAELTDKTIPAETGLVPLTVNFTKGCYTGQELVARIDSRGGHVPRHLRGLRLGEDVAAGTELFDGETSVGTVTSVARSEQHGWVGLGYVKRGIEPPRRVEAGAQRVSTEVVALPS
ncbi:MAG: folate-binding protein YgfZ [Acidimicrobiales bacterium]|nr:folate-binding protein YgfZ [Acidimicrobiales bacterium]